LHACAGETHSESSSILLPSLRLIILSLPSKSPLLPTDIFGSLRSFFDTSPMLLSAPRQIRTPQPSKPAFIFHVRDTWRHYSSSYSRKMVFDAMIPASHFSIDKEFHSKSRALSRNQDCNIFGNPISTLDTRASEGRISRPAILPTLSLSPTPLPHPGFLYSQPTTFASSPRTTRNLMYHPERTHELPDSNAPAH